MPRSAALADHTRAGRIEAVRIAARLRGPDEGAVLAPCAPLAAQAPLAPGEIALGPLRVGVGIEPGGERAAVRVTVANAGDGATHLESVVLGFRWTGHGAASLRFLRNGWQSWSFTGSRELDAAGPPPFPSGPWLRGLHHAVPAPAADRDGWHESDLVTAIGASPTGPACLAGVLERGASFGVVYARRDGDDVRIEVELLVDASLAAGETRELETVRMALGEDPSALLEAYAEELGRASEARAAHPFRTGWCSWYHFFHDVTEADVLRNLEALVAARGELPVDVVQIDDGFQRATGDWLDANAKFPRGIAPLAAEIRDAGFTPGLWTAPFCAVRESELFAKHADWLLRGEDGEPFRCLVHPMWAADGSVFALDPSRPEVVAHLEGLFRALVEMGFEYLKLDFLFASAMRARSFDPGVSRAGRLRRGLEAVRAGAGEEAFLLGCGSPLGAAVGVVDAMRIGPDVAPSWRPRPGFDIPGIEETVPATKSAVRSVLARAWMHRRLWINDPDCLMTRAGDTELSRAERETLGAAIAATGGLVVFSDDVPALSPESRALLRTVSEIAGHVDGLGIPGRARVPDLLAEEIPGVVLAADAESTTVALVNAGDEPRARRAEIPGDDSTRARRLLGARIEGGPSARLDPHESAVVRVERAFPLAVFCDFDGTFSVQDVGSTLARRHVGERRGDLWVSYERGDLTAWEYNMEILEGLELSREEVVAFLHTVELDPGARDLVAWCEEHEVPFRVLSDGFDFNLSSLQQIHGISYGYDTNRLDFRRGAWRIAPSFPNPDCFCGTGACKRGRLEAFRERHPHATLVHVGNGKVSDLCGALAADVAFAKETLADELDRRGVAYERFETLRDVVRGLEGLLGRLR